MKLKDLIESLQKFEREYTGHAIDIRECDVCYDDGEDPFYRDISNIKAVTDGNGIVVIILAEDDTNE